MGIGASKTVHERMINSMVDAPVNLFYDVTPLGRLLNRLSKDLNIIDESISRNYGSVLAEIMNVGSKVAIVLIFFPILCIIVPILLYLSYRVKEKYLNISRELTRLEAVSRSPILNNFGETISGAKIIRTFKQTQNYREKNYNVLNVNSKIQYSLYAAKA